jgi:hypothetical protein
LTVLHCSSVETALVSLADLLGLGEPELRKRLAEERVDERFEERLRIEPYDELVWSDVTGRPINSTLAPSEVVWFHATRVPPETPFSKTGLLPLKNCLPALRAEVRRIADELNILPEGGFVSPSYCSKLSALEEQGPCAFLLRDAALGRSDSHRNFLKAPEIVEDLALQINGKRFKEILTAYQRITKRCIVSFRSSEPRPDVARRALAYCHAFLHGRENPPRWNTCFCGRGKAVPPSDLLRIEWLDG